MIAAHVHAESRWQALLALLLIAPVPSIGIIANFYAGPIGTWIWAAAKAWLLLMPAVWHLLIDRRPISWSPPRNGGFLVGAITGLVIAAGIFVAYLLIGDLMPAADLREGIQPKALLQLPVFIAAAIYWITINSLLEEYVYRWFIFRKAEVVAGGKAAVVISGLVFVVHHTIAMAHYVEPWINVLSSIGIFIGGALWSYLYLRYRSVWIPWLSHAIVDIAIFAIAGWMIYGQK